MHPTLVAEEQLVDGYRGRMVRFNPPPGWPPAPDGWLPTPSSPPDPSWPAPPPGWAFYLDDQGAPTPPPAGAWQPPQAGASAPGTPGAAGAAGRGGNKGCLIGGCLAVAQAKHNIEQNYRTCARSMTPKLVGSGTAGRGTWSAWQGRNADGELFTSWFVVQDNAFVSGWAPDGVDAEPYADAVTSQLDRVSS